MGLLGKKRSSELTPLQRKVFENTGGMVTGSAAKESQYASRTITLLGLSQKFEEIMGRLPTPEELEELKKLV